MDFWDGLGDTGSMTAGFLGTVLLWTLVGHSIAGVVCTILAGIALF